MKKTFIIALLVMLALPGFSQDDSKRQHGRKHKDITELVNDLSASQKRKIDALTKESVERVSELRRQQKAVRDSIHMFMERDGDQSATLFPLFEREADLQVAVSREMYATKLKIDEVLTKEQRIELRNASSKANRHKGERKE